MLARSMIFTARSGAAEELAELLVRVSGRLRTTPGCLSWVVSRNPEAPDEVWVQELWTGAGDAERALADDGAGPSPADVMALCAGPPQRTDLAPVGGVGIG